MAETIGQSGLCESHRSRSHHWLAWAFVGDRRFINSMIPLQTSIFLCACVCSMFVSLFVLSLHACQESDRRLLIMRETDQDRCKRRAKWARKSSFCPQLLDADPPPPSQYPIPFVQTEEKGCRRNKQTGLWSPRWWIPKPLFPPLSLYSHSTSSTVPNHSLAKQWCTHHLSFLRPVFLSARLSFPWPFIRRRSISSRRLPPSRLPHAVNAIGVNISCHRCSRRNRASRRLAQKPVLSVRSGWQAGGIVGNKQGGFGFLWKRRVSYLLELEIV